MDKLGKYTNLEKVGSGTMGVVYRAHDDSLGNVAVKVMSAELAGSKRSRQRFIREARVAASLVHPNIIDIHGMGEEDGRPYIVMEYLEGEALKPLIRRGDPISLERALDWTKQVVGALAYAHDSGVAHRDIKPDNIFVTLEGDVRLLDFGIARLKDSTMTATGVVMGTPAYMAPEQVLGKKVDGRSDVFSVGTVLYELLTGERAFPGERVDLIFDKIMKHQPLPVHRLKELVPKPLSAIVHKAMSKAPEQRYQTMDELLDHLTRFDRLLAKLRDEVRHEAEAGLVRLRALGDPDRLPVAPNGVSENSLPEGYYELHAFVRGLADEQVTTDAMIGEFEWVEGLETSSLGEYSDGGLRKMANRIDEIRELAPESSGPKRLGRRLVDELKSRLKPPPQMPGDSESSGEFA